MVFRGAALVALWFALTPAAPSTAQPTSVPAGARVRVAVSRENPKDTRSPPIQGTLVAADDSSFAVMPRGTGASLRHFPINPRLRLEVHAGTRGTRVGSGALAGLIAGAVIGFGLGAAADTECECRMALGGVSGLVFGLGGTLIGAGFGSMVPRDVWRPVPLPVRLEPRPPS